MYVARGGYEVQWPKVWDPPGAGVAGGCEAPDDAWNRTQVL